MNELTAALEKLQLAANRLAVVVATLAAVKGGKK